MKPEPKDISKMSVGELFYYTAKIVMGGDLDDAMDMTIFDAYVRGFMRGAFEATRRRENGK